LDKLRAVIDKSTEARAVGVELSERRGRREIMTLIAAGTSSPGRRDGSASLVGRDEADEDEGKEGGEEEGMDIDLTMLSGTASHHGTAAKSTGKEKDDPKSPRPKAWKSAGIHLHVRPDLGEDKGSLERLEVLLRRVQSSG
jgi:hypothetical protein